MGCSVRSWVASGLGNSLAKVQEVTGLQEERSSKGTRGGGRFVRCTNYLLEWWTPGSTGAYR